MKKILLILFAAANLVASDLWISILSLPPEPGVKAFGIYAHCPTPQKQSRLEVYEILDLVNKKKLGDFTANISEFNTDLRLTVQNKDKTTLLLILDRSHSTSVAPYEYRTWMWVDTNFYCPTIHQWTLSGMMLNPIFPETEPRPIWHEPLSDCKLK